MVGLSAASAVSSCAIPDVLTDMPYNAVPPGVRPWVAAPVLFLDRRLTEALLILLNQ